MRQAAIVPVQEATTCSVCGTEGARATLVGRSDREYSVPDRLAYWRCTASGCGHVFVRPVPSSETLGRFYQTYSTHAAPGPLPRWLGFLLWLHDSAGVRTILRTHSPATTRCLDYGCGSGHLLATLEQHGFSQLHGYDPDGQARSAAATHRQLQVHVDEGAALAAGPYDLIVMNHVVEHLVDPVETLDRLLGALAPGGILLLRTPNANSLLARWFGDGWRGWETPRHLQIYTPGSLRQVLTLLASRHPVDWRCRTSHAMFLGMFHESRRRSSSPASGKARVVRHLLGMAAWLAADGLRWVWRSSGEELCAVVRRRPESQDR